jgi:hypothetical protein
MHTHFRILQNDGHKSAKEDKRKLVLKPANFYQAAIYGWNAYREGKTITSVKYDAKKGLYTVAA